MKLFKRLFGSTCALLFSFGSLSTQAAGTFDDVEGVVYLPSVNVGEESYDVEMKHNGDLVFEVIIANASSSSISSNNHYDPESGVLTVPSVVLGDFAYDVEMEHLGDLVFQVTKAEETTLTSQVNQETGVEIKVDGFPTIGNLDAAIDVVLFADLASDNSQVIEGYLASLLADYGDQVKVTIMDVSLGGGEISSLIAQGTLCAEAQGQYLEYRDLVLNLESVLSADSLVAIAETLGIDLEAFASCMISSDTSTKVGSALALAESLGLSGEPVIYVNGQEIDLSSYSALVSQILLAAQL